MDPATAGKVSARTLRVLAALLWVLTDAGAWAAADDDADSRSEAPGPPAERLGTRILDRAATLRERVSRRILDSADRIDLFFGDERMAVDHNGSYLQIDSGVRFEERADVVNQLLVRGKLDLPRTERRFRLVLETDRSDTGSSAEPADPAGDPIEAAADSRYRLALRYLAHMTRGIHLKLDAGLRFDSGLQLFTRARAGGAVEMADWAARASQTLTWRDDDGWLSVSRLDLDRPIHERLFFRAATGATWSEATEQFDLSQDLVLFRQLDARNQMSYRLGARGASEPVVAATGYLADLRYRHRIHQQWLFLDIRPAVDWRRVDSFEPVYSLSFTLSAIFSER